MILMVIYLFFFFISDRDLLFGIWFICDGMGMLLFVVYSIVRVIVFCEFLDVFYVICNFRFFYDCGCFYKFIVFVISGGVDFMVLVYFFIKIRMIDYWFKVVDYFVSNFVVFVVNYDLWKGMVEEVDQVIKVLRGFKIFVYVVKIDWVQVLGKGVDFNMVFNIEIFVCQQCYWKLGIFVRNCKIMFLFMVYYEDDQYEIIFMRLFFGYGYCGLRGMCLVIDIFECYDMYGIYQSGFIDDQRSKYFVWNIYLNRVERIKIL